MGDSEVISLFYQDRQEAVDIIDTGGAIVRFLTRETPICSLLGTVIKPLHELGSGSFGSAFEVTFPHENRRRYVVKIVDADVARYNPKDFKGTRPTYNDLAKHFRIDVSVIFAFNRINQSPDDRATKALLIPIFLSPCDLLKEMTIVRVDRPEGSPEKEMTLLPGDALVCKGIASEFAISLLAAEAYESGQSINFLDVFDVATCGGKSFEDGTSESSLMARPIRHYTFMQMATTTLWGYHKSMSTNGGIPDGEVDAFVFQILHTVLLYQEHWKIVHGDLHAANVFLERIDEETKWTSSIGGSGPEPEALAGAEFFEYRIGSRSIWIPKASISHIVKMGDWGLACKYSRPPILNWNVIANGHDQGDGALVPNYFSTLYDPIMILHDLLTMGYKTKFMQEILKIAYGSSPAAKKKKRITLKDLITSIHHGGLSIVTTIGSLDRPDPTILSKPEYASFDLRLVLTNAELIAPWIAEPPSGSRVVRLGVV